MTEFNSTNYLSEKPLVKYAAVLAASVALAGCAKGIEATPTSTTETTTTTSASPATTTVETTLTTTEFPATPETTELPPAPSDVINCMVERCIALTFDDGPGPYTERLLTTLAERNAKATFFLVGNRVKQYATVAKDIRDGGHQLGNHSWAHDQLTAKESSAAADDIARTNQTILDQTGVMPTIMRPPYGATNTSIIDAVGMPEIIWSVDPEDWAIENRDSTYVADYVVGHASRGDIVLMHDIHPTTVDAVPRIVDELQSQNYKLVTVDTLLGANLPVGKYSQQTGVN